MTLLVTEIHNPDDPVHAAIVFGADRRISAGTKYHGSKKKLFEIPSLNGSDRMRVRVRSNEGQGQIE